MSGYSGAVDAVGSRSVYGQLVGCIPVRTYIVPCNFSATSFATVSFFRVIIMAPKLASCGGEISVLCCGRGFLVCVIGGGVGWGLLRHWGDRGARGVLLARCRCRFGRGYPLGFLGCWVGVFELDFVGDGVDIQLLVGDVGERGEVCVCCWEGRWNYF